jgi:hypothetical protein
MLKMNTLSNDEWCVCGSSQLVTIPDSGEIVCQHCGAVISDKAEEKGPEWCTFVASTESTFVTSMEGREGDDQNRTGMPFSIVRADMAYIHLTSIQDPNLRGDILHPPFAVMTIYACLKRHG